MTTENEFQPSYFSVIPGHVRQCKSLVSDAKLLYGDIASLCNIHGYCWATNEHFALMHDVDRRTIVNWLKSLKDHKFIYVETEVIGIQRRRKIWISLEAKRHFKNNITKGKSFPYVGKIDSLGVPPSPYILNNTIDIKNTKKTEISPTAQQLSNQLKEKILEINPHFSDPTDRWPKMFEEMLKKKSKDHILCVMNWTFANEFWQSKVPSATYFKKKFTTLEMQMQEPKKQEKSWKSYPKKNFSKNEKNASLIEPETSKKTISDEDMQMLRSRFPEILGRNKS